MADNYSRTGQIEKGEPPEASRKGILAEGTGEAGSLVFFTYWLENKNG